MPLAEGLRNPSRRTAIGLCVLLSLVVGLPYVLAGPGFFLDDWFALRGGRLDGWESAAGRNQWLARPGAGAVYALTFGLLQDQPLVYGLISLGLLCVSAVLIFVIGDRLISRPLALAVAATWVVLPNHSSLEVWPSAINISLALVLALGAIALAITTVEAWRTDLAAALLAASATLTYEAVAPAATIAVLVLAWRRGRLGRRLGALVVGGQAVALTWMVVNWHPQKQGIDRWLRPESVFEGHFGRGIFGPGVRGDLGVLVVFALVVVTVGLRVRRERWGDARVGRLLTTGAALLVLGALPFVRYFYAPWGFGDRVTVVSGVGAACILVALALDVWARAPVIAIAGIVVLSLGVVAWRAEQTYYYAVASDDGRRILDEVIDRYPEPPEAQVVFGPAPILEHNIGPFLQYDWALHWLYGTKDLDVVTRYDGFESERTDEPSTFDVEELSRLDDVARS